jgi:hypothetical protein
MQVLTAALQIHAENYGLTLEIQEDDPGSS